MTRLSRRVRAIALLATWALGVAFLDSIYPAANLSLRTVALAFTAGGGLGVLNTVLFERMEELRNGSRRRPLRRQVMLTALVFVGSLAVGVLVVSIDWSGALSVGADAVPAIWLAAFASMLVAGLLNLGPRVNSEGR